jgi:hypothetical protein
MCINSYSNYSYHDALNLNPIPSSWKLDDLFWNLAQRSQYFPSDKQEGNTVHNNKTVTPDLPWFTDPNGTPWPDTTGWIIEAFNPFNNYIAENNLRQIGDKLMPLAIQYTAALYKLFWNEVHPQQDNFMPVPTGQESFPYLPSVSPILSIDPSQAKPIGVGSVATGGDTLSLRVGLPAFSGPVNIYLGIYTPPDIWIIKSDLSIHHISNGFIPWKVNTTGPIDDPLYGDIPVSSLPEGEYYPFLYIEVAPSGSTNAYYLWMTYFDRSGYSISGRVTLSGSGLSGVTINLTGSTSASTTTDSNGNYTFTGIQNGSYTITPSKSGYTFNPSSMPVTVSNNDVTVQDFVATSTGINRSWIKTFGGPNDDLAGSVQQTSDGGYIIAGNTYSYGAGGSDVYLIKTDANGNKLWERTFGGINDDYGESVQQTSDGGYIIAGYTYSYGAGGSDVYLIKTDANGNKLWESTFGGINDDYGESVQQTSDSGYIISGIYGYSSSDADLYLIKTDANGNKLWDKIFGGPNDDYGKSVQQTSDGGYIVVGVKDASFSYSGDHRYISIGDVYLVKTGASGDKLWEKTYGTWGTGEVGLSVRQTSDGGYAISGWKESYLSSYDVYLIKTDSSGNELWEKTYGGPNDDYGDSVQQTSDGGFVISGLTKSYGAGGSDVYLIKTDANGNKSWEKTFGGTSDERGLSVQQTSDGGYIIAGFTDSYGVGGNDVYLIKTDANGNAQTQSTSLSIVKSGVSTLKQQRGSGIEPLPLSDKDGGR